jgi:hypothetical protein
VRDEPRVAWVVQPLHHPAHDAEPLDHLAEDDRPRFGRQTLGPGLDPK